MQKSYRKNIRRDFRSNLNRFLSLFGIVALGVMMLTGLVSFAPSMRTAGQKYYVQQNVFDLRVLSTLGLSESDLSAIAATEGVSAVMPVKYLDTEGRWSSSTDGAVLRVQQLPADPAADTEANMNRLTLLEGRMPETANECVVQVLGHADPVPLGTVVTLPEDTEDIRRTEYTVVGQVQDPQYFSANQETSTVGDGILDALVFVQDGELTADYYTVCYLKVADAAQYDNYSDEYQTAVNTVADRLDAISKEHCVARRAQLIEDATTQLDDAKQTYSEQKAEAERQFAQAEQKLTDAQRELDAAKAQLDAGEAELAAQKAALPNTMQSGADKLVSSEEQVLEFEDQLQQIELLVNLKQVADPLLGYAETALNNAQKALDEAEPEDEEYTELRDALAKAQAAYDNIKGQLDGYQAQLDAGKQQMYAKRLISSPNLSNTDLVTEAKAALRKMKVQLLQGQLQLSTGTATAYTQFEAARAQLDEGWQQYNEGLAQYEAGKQQLAGARAQIEDGWATLQDKKLQMADARRQINDAKGRLRDARSQLDDAKAAIAENLQKLRDGEIEYEDAKAEADRQLADARAQLEDGEAALREVEYPTWYVWDRSKNVSYASFTANVDKLTAITTIFPVFFFLVAALVVSTTMTRMVEEERLQIGTLKALGYSDAAIMQKYLLYAFTAAAAGTVFGLAVGFKAFPSIIWSAYSMMYYMPSIATPWRLGQALFAGGTLIVLTVGITALTCRTTLQENPAALMLPRAPKAGKRILLERITPLWRRLPFSWKVTCRNLLRYKKRFWMTVIGVTGCTSLLVAGFGISDSLNAIITKQYGDIYHYDLLTIVTKQEATESGPVHDYLYNTDNAAESLTVAMESTRQDSPDGEMDVYLMIPEDVDRFADFADLHERLSRKEVPLGQQGVVVTEKMAKTLGIAAGDTLTLTNSDDRTADFTVSGVCEHYVSNYVYISPAVYEAGFGEAPRYNAILSILPSDDEPARDAISADLLAMEQVASLSFTQDSVAQVLNMLNSIDAVVVLIIVCAASLAFVVLYNLSNINIAERVKEIATIKVLGFYDPEVYAYVNRESVALTLIGTLLGLAGGIALHSFVITTVEVDAVMFGRQIYPQSFAYAIALTLLFSTLVNLVMQRLLKRISMVESMKAPE